MVVPSLTRLAKKSCIQSQFVFKTTLIPYRLENQRCTRKVGMLSKSVVGNPLITDILFDLIFSIPCFVICRVDGSNLPKHSTRACYYQRCFWTQNADSEIQLSWHCNLEPMGWRGQGVEWLWGWRVSKHGLSWSRTRLFPSDSFTRNSIWSITDSPGYVKLP